MVTLHELTEGTFNSLNELTEEKIEAFLGRKIPRGNLAPLFDKDGNPLGLQLSYTHAACFAAEIVKRSQRQNATSTKAVADLPIPFWQPVDVVLLTQDGYVVSAMRGNLTKNAVGNCLTAAAGFPRVVDGSAEDALSCAQRELKEETGLTWAEVAERVISKEREFPFGMVTDRPLQTFDIATPEGTIPGCVPTVARTFAVKTQKKLEELVAAMQLNHEPAGIVAVRFDDFKTMAQDRNACVPARFWPSSHLKEVISPVAIAQAQGGTLEPIRQALRVPGAPKPREGCYGLDVPMDCSVSGPDFMHNESLETLEKTAAAITALSFIRPHTAPLSQGY